MKLALIGFMGSGKSSVAKELSVLSNIPILEMDQHVLNKTGFSSMQQLFANGGEQLLRQTEMELVKEHLPTQSLIVSTGGGIVTNPDTMLHLKNNHTTIFFLNTTFQTIQKRLHNDTTRPLFQQNAQELYNLRLPLYLKYADHIVSTDSLSPKEIAKQVLLFI